MGRAEEEARRQAQAKDRCQVSRKPDWKTAAGRGQVSRKPTLPLDARTLRAVARRLGKRALGVDHSTDPYCIGMACAFRVAMRACNTEARAIERKSKPATPGKRKR